MGKWSALRMCTGPLSRNTVIGVERAAVVAAEAGKCAQGGNITLLKCLPLTTSTNLHLSIRCQSQITPKTLTDAE